jgi:hypothetical protein
VPAVAVRLDDQALFRIGEVDPRHEGSAVADFELAFRLRQARRAQQTQEPQLEDALGRRRPRPSLVEHADQAPAASAAAHAETVEGARELGHRGQPAAQPIVER